MTTEGGASRLRTPSDGRSGALGRRLVAEMEWLTGLRCTPLAIENARRSAARISAGKSISALRNHPMASPGRAIVVGNGPSIERRDSIERIAAHGFEGVIVATDSGLKECLKWGVVPHLVVSLDPNPVRIVRWFGDPDLTDESVAMDDYFRRTGADIGVDEELARNRAIMTLMERHAPGLPIALSSSASPAVVRRVHELGMDVHWWNPMHDDPAAPDSMTLALHRENRLPCLNGGGNVGTCAWMFAHAVLGKTEVALIGIDFGYYPDQPYHQTGYYPDAVALVGEDDVDSIYIWEENPELGALFYTDPACLWYRNCLRELVLDAGCRTYNCTEGGILYGEGIETMPLERFLTARSRGE